MKDQLNIYLSGSIKKENESQVETYWTDHDLQIIQKALSPTTVNFFNPSLRSDDLSDRFSAYGRDLFQIYSSDVVFVDARNKKGIGVGAEMMFAKTHSIPVISWLPPNSHYHRSNLSLCGQTLPLWIHAYILNLSDFLAHSLEEAIEWILEELLMHKAKIKGPESTQFAMQHYLREQLKNDKEMQNFIHSSQCQLAIKNLNEA